ncbi:MAG: hypothetical protein NTV51_16260, partial [Verrucomicrobia bacterium]|nr:hypothetical protein [Verrucomicrobiota bacterium]
MNPEIPGGPRDERIDRAIEGLLSAEELAVFKADVVRDPALRAAYVERGWIHALLKAERARLPSLIDRPAEPAPSNTVRRGPWYFVAAAAGLAAAVALGFALSRGRGAAPEQTVATLIQSQNTKWAGSTLPTLERSKLGRGTLALVEGIATLRFDSGATVTIEAPTKLEILSAMRCRLIEGSATAEVPEPAHGFTIDTPDLKVVDLGTRFGVT